MGKVLVEKQNLQDIANSIRQKEGSQELMSPAEMAERIDGISTGIDTSDATATASDMASGKTAYVNGQKIRGNVFDYGTNTWKPQYPLTINSIGAGEVSHIINFSNVSSMFRKGGVINVYTPFANAAVAIGLTADKLKKDEVVLGVSGSVVELQGQTKIVTPTTEQQIITPDQGYNGLTQVTVEAVEDLTPQIQAQEQIIAQLQEEVNNKAAGEPNLQSKEITITQNGITTVIADTGYDGLSDVDVTVSGILDTSDATVTANDMEQGKTAYVNGQKVTGTLTTVYRTGSIAQSITSDNQGVSFVMKTYTKNIYNKNAEITVTAQKTELAPVIGATASKIKKDEVICGVTGTYEGEGGNKAVLPDKIKFGTYASETNNMDWLTNVDTSNITNANYMFYKCTNLTTSPQFDTSNITAMYEMFYGCTALVSVSPMNTSKVQSMKEMFQGCTSLRNVPVLDTQRLNSGGIGNMFKGCPSLSNESLNNILQMCINTVNETYKNLFFVGLTSEQATTCQSLSNWDAFVAAGWSTGY